MSQYCPWIRFFICVCWITHFFVCICMDKIRGLHSRCKMCLCVCVCVAWCTVLMGEYWPFLFFSFWQRRAFYWNCFWSRKIEKIKTLAVLTDTNEHRPIQIWISLGFQWPWVTKYSWGGGRMVSEDDKADGNHKIFTSFTDLYWTRLHCTVAKMMCSLPKNWRALLSV